MKNRGTSSKNQGRIVQRVLITQGLLTIVISLLLWWLKGPVWAYSAMLGGLIYLLPSLYQASKVLAQSSAKNIRAVLRELYKSEIWKMALTMVLFGMVFVLVKPIEPFPLFGVFIAMQMIAWLMPIAQNQKLFKN